MPQDLKLAVAPDGSLRIQGLPPSAIRASGVPGGTSPMYGAGGLFGVVGAHPQLINATVGPMGFERYLQWVPSSEDNPLYDALTYIGSSGYTQSGKCTDCGTPSFRECLQTACFGRICQQTNEHAFDDIGRKMNRGVPEVAMFGSITDPAGNTIIPQGQPIQSMFTLEVMGVAYNLRRRLGQLLWSGNPANNNGGYMEFPGFARLIATGKTGALSGIACDGLDSYIRSYGSNVVGVAGSPSIVQYVTGMIRSIRYRIGAANFDIESAETYLVMHPITWDCVADAWACQYGLVCTTDDAPTRNDAMAIAEYRDRLRREHVLTVDGKEYTVVEDNGMPITRIPFGNYTAHCGDIYAITTRVGGKTVCWGEFLDLQANAGHVIQYFRQMFGATFVSLTDGGRFAVAPTTSGGFCFDVRVLARPRLINIMPFVSGRITNVCCVPQGTYPDVTGSGGIYEVGGGTSHKPYLGLYGDCGGQDEYVAG